MMNHNRFEIYRGREINGQLVGLRLAGYAFQNEGESFYRVKLLMFPENIYFMSKNQGAGYTIFSKMVAGDESKVVFQNPVGFAKLMDHVKTHLYVRFPDLASHMFMSLFPCEKKEAA
jgi:hypothetical protein